MDEKIQKVFAQLNEWDQKMQTVPTLGIASDYDREQYDNVYMRNKYKNNLFGAKKTYKDYLTGKTLHKNAKMAKNKYGTEATQHTMDIDHITPIALVHDLVQGNPLLTKDNVRTAVNREWNLRGTPANINRSKGAKTNFEMSVESFKNCEIEKGAKQLSDGTISAASIGTELTVQTGINAGEFAVKKGYKTVRNIPANIQDGITVGSRAIENTGNILRKGTGMAIDGASDALDGAVMYVGMEAVRNLYLMAEGEITAEEAARRTGKMAINIARTGAAERVVAESLKSIATNTKNELLKNVLKSNKAAEVGVLSIMIAGSVLQSMFSHENVDTEQIFKDLFHDTIGSFSGIMQTAAILLPVPGLSVAVATSLVVTAVCSTVYSLGQTVFNSGQGMAHRLEQVTRLEHQALAEMSYQRNILKMMVQDEFENWDITVENAFEKIMSDMMKNNVDGISLAINDVFSLVGKSVRFKSKKDFDDFFMKDKLEFTF